MNRHTEKMTAAAAASASIGRNVAVAEQAHAQGRYVAECFGPVEAFRARYVEVRDMIAKIETGGVLRRLSFRGLLASLRAELALIPIEKKWADAYLNLVTTVGGNDMLDKYLAGSAYTATWYLGLISATSYTTGPNVADTMASHSGWTEDQNYSQTSRPTTAWNAAASKTKALSAALSFSINASTTIKGSFLTSVNTKGGTTGTLFSAGLFTGGDKVVANGDTLNVSYQAGV